MADRMQVTSIMTDSLPRGTRLVSPGRQSMRSVHRVVRFGSQTGAGVGEMPSFRLGDLPALEEEVGIAQRNKGRCLARVGRLDRRVQANLRCLLRSGTPEHPRTGRRPSGPTNA